MIQKPKGTYDVYGKKSKQIKYIEKILKKSGNHYILWYNHSEILDWVYITYKR